MEIEHLEKCFNLDVTLFAGVELDQQLFEFALDFVRNLNVLDQ
jgi:hypothetical protein